MNWPMKFRTQNGEDDELQLTITTTDLFEKQVCESYWEFDGNSYSKPIAAIARQFSTTSVRINAIVERGCFVVRTNYKCWRCDKPIGVFRRRQEFEDSLHAHLTEPDTYGFCPDCLEEVQREAQESRVQTKLKNMLHAVDACIYQSLNPVECEFLVQLASSVSIDMAQRLAGISKKYATKLLKKFDSLYLIDRSTPPGVFEAVTMLDELRNILRNAPAPRKGKSIFGSQETFDLFRKLKAKHPFVYPEVPVCAFIENSDIQRVVKKDDLSCFMICRVNFLICEHDGTPSCAVDYQADSEDAEQLKCRELKAKVLSAIGLPLSVVNSANAGKDAALP
jgi:hypothetical protein